MAMINVDGAEYVKVKMPMVGLGTWEIRAEREIFEVLEAGLEAGYRFIDSAQGYGNEKHVGKALKLLLPKFNLKREDIFITTKLAPSNQGAESCGASIDKSLADLDSGYIDLLLIHWPGSKLKGTDERNSGLRKESWEIMEQYYGKGKLKAIGVSNYLVCHLKELMEHAKVLPAVNQCEYHPHYCKPDVVAFCKERGIHFQAYSSFGSGSHKSKLFNDNKIIEAAKRNNISVTHFLLAWSICQGISVLPRSKNPDHIRDNFKAKEIKISHEDIESVKSEEFAKYCWDPENIL